MLWHLIPIRFFQTMHEWISTKNIWKKSENQKLFNAGNFQILCIERTISKSHEQNLSFLWAVRIEADQMKIFSKRLFFDHFYNKKIIRLWPEKIKKINFNSLYEMPRFDQKKSGYSKCTGIVESHSNTMRFFVVRFPIFYSCDDTLPQCYKFSLPLFNT